MPEVKVTLDSLTDESAKVAPLREPVPPGVYQAVIMAAPLGVTKGPPVLQKISVEFQILFNDEDKGDAQSGRRVYQDYLLEKIPGNPSFTQQRRYELVQLLEACGVPYTENSFNTDHLVNKVVKITVRHRKGKAEKQGDPIPVFANVAKVDTAEDVAEGDLV